jgi:hypothetical protein
MPTSIGPGPELRWAKSVVDAAGMDAGRDPAGLGFEGRVMVRPDFKSGDLARLVDEWRELGATHITIDTRRCGLRDSQHVDLLARVAATLQQY